MQSEEAIRRLFQQQAGVGGRQARSEPFKDRSIFRHIPSKVEMENLQGRRKMKAEPRLQEIKAAMAKIDEQLNDPNTRLTPDKHKALVTMKLQLEQSIHDSPGMAKLQETDDFNQWLLGRGKEEDHVRTPWYRTPLLTLPGARDYILRFVKDRFKFLQYVHSLQLTGPTDVKQALEYFRYIIRGREDGKLNYLEEWSRIDSMNVMTRKYGKGVAEKLANWPLSRGPVMPEKEMQLIATDFQAYIKHHWENDEDKRQALFEEDGLRDELLVRLATLQHHADIRRAMEEYYQRFEEKDNVLLLNIRAMTELVKQQRALDSRFNQLPTHMMNSPNVIDAYHERRQEYEDRIREVDNKIQELFRQVARDPSKVKELQKLLSRDRVPTVAQEILSGNPSEEALFSLIADEIEAGQFLVDEARVLAAEIRSVADDNLPSMFTDPNGNPDPARIDNIADLLKDIDSMLTRLEVHPTNRQSFQ